MAGPSRSLTSGGIFYSLARFSLPVLLTLFLQALYGGIDLLVVGQFASTADVSGVSTGSMLLSTFTMLVTGLSMGPTVTVGEAIGSGSPKEAGRAVLAGLTLLGSLAVLLTLGLALFAQPLAALLDAPRGVLRANPGGLGDEPSARNIALPDRLGHTGILAGAGSALRRVLPAVDAKKRKGERIKNGGCSAVQTWDTIIPELQHSDNRLLIVFGGCLCSTAKVNQKLLESFFNSSG